MILGNSSTRTAYVSAPRSFVLCPNFRCMMHVRRCLRLCTHFLLFIYGFSNITEHFNCLLRNNAKFRSHARSDLLFMSSSVHVNLGNPVTVLMALRLRVSKLFFCAFMRRMRLWPYIILDTSNALLEFLVFFHQHPMS